MSVFRLALASLVMSVAAARTCDAAIEVGVLNQIQFDNREYFESSDGILGNIGDRLVGVLNTNTINTPNGIQSPVTPEVTGVFDLTIQFFIKVSNTQAYMLLRPTNVTGAEGRLAGHAPGTALAVYEGGVSLQATLDDAGKSRNDAIAAAMDGTLVDDFGFGAVATEGAGAFDSPSDWGAAGNGYWFATVTGAFDPLAPVGSLVNTTASLSPSSFFYYGLQGLGGLLNYQGLGNTDLNTFTIPGATQVGQNFEDIFTNPSITFALTGKGSTKVNNNGAGTTAADQAKFPIFSNDPARLFPTSEVPEPATLLVWTTLLGIGTSLLKYRSSKA